MNLNYVRFDVGHYLYCCHKNTIEKYKDSVLAKYIAPEFDKRQSGLDYVVIDRNGKHFGDIINFMRDQSSLNPKVWSDNDLVDLMREADFYCLADLVELCDNELTSREHVDSASSACSKFAIPSNCKLEVIFGISVMRQAIQATNKRTLVINYNNMRKFHIDSWIEELVKITDYNKFEVYCLADKDEESSIVALYEPAGTSPTYWISAPPTDKFRTRRAHYKCKVFKFWFLAQNNQLHTITRKIN